MLACFTAQVGVLIERNRGINRVQQMIPAAHPACCLDYKQASFARGSRLESGDRCSSIERARNRQHL